MEFESFYSEYVEIGEYYVFIDINIDLLEIDYYYVQQYNSLRSF